MEQQRDAWFAVPDLAAQKKIGAEMQVEAFDNVPFYPLGADSVPAEYHRAGGRLPTLLERAP